MIATCRLCGCTEDNPCIGGCAWTTEKRDLCSNCAGSVLDVVMWALEAHSPNLVAFATEVQILYEQSKAEPPDEPMILEATEAQLRAMARAGAS